MNNINNLYQVSKLEKSDYNRGFLDLLAQLSPFETNKITFDEFSDYFDNINSDIYVIRDISLNKIVASGTLLIEKKFIHNLSSVGHVEDIVVSKEYRGMGLGKSLMEHLVKKSNESNCYKIILNCNKNNAAFYKKCNFKLNEIQMVHYFKSYD
jgi:glucosamine-phosphate N-acetyltransferase